MSPLVIGIAAVVVAVLISRAIPNSARSGGSPYTASNLGACFLMALVGLAAAVLILAPHGGHR